MRRFTPIILLIAALSISLCSCEREDDVMEIFTGKTWKMSYIFPDGQPSTPIDFWEGFDNPEEAYKISNELAKDKSSYNLIFKGGLLNTGKMGGTFEGRAVNATVEGYWTADGDTRALQFSDVKWKGSDTDVLAKAFIRGLSANVYKYAGDNSNLYIHFKDGQLTRVIALVPKK